MRKHTPESPSSTSKDKKGWRVGLMEEREAPISKRNHSRDWKSWVKFSYNDCFLNMDSVIYCLNNIL